MNPELTFFVPVWTLLIFWPCLWGAEMSCGAEPLLHWQQQNLWWLWESALGHHQELSIKQLVSQRVGDWILFTDLTLLNFHSSVFLNHIESNNRAKMCTCKPHHHCLYIYMHLKPTQQSTYLYIIYDEARTSCTKSCYKIMLFLFFICTYIT